MINYLLDDCISLNFLFWVLVFNILSNFLLDFDFRVEGEGECEGEKEVVNHFIFIIFVF